jgi:tetratricopeptide (TPR) repeat protein
MEFRTGFGYHTTSMSVPFLKRASLSFLLLVCVSLIVLPECYPVKNALTPEVSNVPAAKEEVVKPSPQQSSEIKEKDYGDNDRFLNYFLLAIGITVGVLTLVVTIAVAFGLFEPIKNLIRRKSAHIEIEDLKKELRAIIDTDKKKESYKLSIELERAQKIIAAFNEKYNEVENLLKGISLPPLTEKPSEDIKKKLDEFSKRIGVLEALGVTLKAMDYFNLGTDYYYKKEYEKSLMAYEKAIELKPDLAVAWTNKGVALGDLGRHEESIKAHEKAIALKPDYAEAWSKKGIALGNLGRHEESIKAYEKAIALKPDYAEAWNNKGIALRDLGRHEEALKAYEKATELKPDYAQAWHNKGIILSKLGKLDDALISLKEATELKPDYANAWFNLACAYALKGNKENTLQHLKKAIELDGKYKEMAKTDKDFKSLWEDEDFKKLVE